MNESQDTEQAHAPAQYLRLPVPVIAGALVVFLAVLLGVGLYANANLRPQGIVVPTQAAAVVPTAPSAAIATVARPTATTAATTSSVRAAAVTAETTPASSSTGATVAVTPEQTALVVTQATGTALPTAVPAATTEVAAPPTARPTVSPELQSEIDDAYRNYWQVRAEALYELDTSRLEEVMAGDHLSAVEDRIGELQTEGRAIQTEVDHNYAIIEANDDDAKVADSYIDRSIYVDVKTHAQLTQPTDQHINEVYVMNRSNGAWRIIDLVRSP
jgi:hypothetical protein